MKPKAWWNMVLTVMALGLATAAGAAVRESRPGHYSGYYDLRHGGATVTSMYVPMRDEVRLSVSYHLPRRLKKSERLPAILIQTRYWRNMVVNLADDNTGKYLCARGYAVVAAR